MSDFGNASMSEEDEPLKISKTRKRLCPFDSIDDQQDNFSEATNLKSEDKSMENSDDEEDEDEKRMLAWLKADNEASNQQNLSAGGPSTSSADKVDRNPPKKEPKKRKMFIDDDDGEEDDEDDEDEEDEDEDENANRLKMLDCPGCHYSLYGSDYIPEQDPKPQSFSDLYNYLLYHGKEFASNERFCPFYFFELPDKRIDCRPITDADDADSFPYVHTFGCCCHLIFLGMGGKGGEGGAMDHMNVYQSTLQITLKSKNMGCTDQLFHFCQCGHHPKPGSHRKVVVCQDGLQEDIKMKLRNAFPGHVMTFQAVWVPRACTDRAATELVNFFEKEVLPNSIPPLTRIDHLKTHHLQPADSTDFHWKNYLEANYRNIKVPTKGRTSCEKAGKAANKTGLDRATHKDIFNNRDYYGPGDYSAIVNGYNASMKARCGKNKKLNDKKLDIKEANCSRGSPMLSLVEFYLPPSGSPGIHLRTLVNAIKKQHKKIDFQKAKVMVHLHLLAGEVEGRFVRTDGGKDRGAALFALKKKTGTSADLDIDEALRTHPNNFESALPQLKIMKYKQQVPVKKML